MYKGIYAEKKTFSKFDPEHERAAEFISEWDDFQSYREQCKEQADALING